MKRYIKYMAFSLLTLGMAACADTDGDGEGEFTFQGSQNPENTSYRNPVWEPSMAGGTLFKAASNYVAISQETQWATGVDYACPSLQSANMMTWSTNQRAFSYPVATGEVDEETGEAIITPGTYPAWITGPITHVTADFCRTIAGANYWMIYATEADNAFGAATASSGLGPYNDLGSFLTAETLGVSTLRYPHFSVISSVNYYLTYTTEDGTYLQQLTLRRGAAPTLRGTATKISGAGFENVCLVRANNNDYYVIGVVGNEIRYARASKVTGPYTDKNGTDLISGSTTGELLVREGTEYKEPTNPMRMIYSENGYYYLAYNATAADKPTMPSGFARRPMFVNPVEMDEDGWFTSVIEPTIGWTKPRFD
ncbi:MAG: hypothetical protein NC336_06235 [Clostridium sp.]|nr:hypothetical protein [Clostridium sp.]